MLIFILLAIILVLINIVLRTETKKITTVKVIDKKIISNTNEDMYQEDLVIEEENEIEKELFPEYKNTKTFEVDDYSKVDFKSDFDKNVLPLLEASISDFVINDVRSFLKSDKLKFCTIDGFWLMNRKEFMSKVTTKIPKRMVAYFLSRYMDAETFIIYIHSRIEELAVVAIATEYKDTPPFYKAPVER